MKCCKYEEHMLHCYLHHLILFRNCISSYSSPCFKVSISLEMRGALLYKATHMAGKHILTSQSRSFRKESVLLLFGPICRSNRYFNQILAYLVLRISAITGKKLTKCIIYSRQSTVSLLPSLSFYQLLLNETFLEAVTLYPFRTLN
jgi:hypothetical protein